MQEMPLRKSLNENMTEEQRLLSFKRTQYILHNESPGPFGEMNNYVFHFIDIQHVHQTHAYNTFRQYCMNSGNVPVEHFFDKPLHAEVVYNLTSSAFLLKLSI